MTLPLVNALHTGNAERAQFDYDVLGAAEFIDLIRLPEGGLSADMDLVVTKVLGGHILCSPLGGDSGRLVRDDPLVISINSAEAACRQEITKAHEVWHYFLRVVPPGMRASWGRADTYYRDGTSGHAAIEAFCDYFAHQLIGVPPCLVGERQQ